MSAAQRVVVVGGGVSGLASAYFLSHDSGDRGPAVTLVEGTARLGGKIRTARFAGRPVDVGPESLLVRAAPLRRLVDRLGLAEDLVAPAPSGAYLWSRGRLRRLPAGSVAGVAARPAALLRAGLLSPAGVARAGADLVLPRRSGQVDVSVGALLGRRFGRQVVRRLADPLVGGLHAGSVDLLSARAALPELAAAGARRERSLWRGLRRAASPPVPGPAMVTLRGGLTQLVDALRDGLGAARVVAGCPAVAVERAGPAYRVRLADGSALDADAVVLAVPAFAAAELLAQVGPQAAVLLRGVPYVDVATVSLAYPDAALGRALDGTGFLVPSGEGTLLVGCTWLSAKWPHLGEGPPVLVRGMVGRQGDQRFADLDDATLVARVHQELAPILDLRAGPDESLVQRWPRAMPQYTVGHQERLDRLDAALDRLPGLVLTGAAYRGVGLAGCVTQAEQAAGAAVAHLARAAHHDDQPDQDRRSA